MERGKLWRSGWFLGVMAVVGCAGSDPGRYEASTPSEEAPIVASEPGGGAQPAPAPPSDGDVAEGRVTASRSRSSNKSFETAPQQPQARPGLGTQWGETRNSAISTSPFSRADASSPFATAALFYNDEEGARSMANASGFKRFSHGGVDIGGGIATVSLKNGSGDFLTGFEASGQRFLVGEAGDRYSIVIESHAPARLEVVISVDGLDVLDGKEASFKKRGYLVDPHGTIEIDGFRQSMETVAAFRFGSVRGSYASQKHGDTRNVGVIGVALFNEQGTSPSTWNRGDTNTRLQADPFPGRFATPP